MTPVRVQSPQRSTPTNKAGKLGNFDISERPSGWSARLDAEVHIYADFRPLFRLDRQ